MGSKPTIIPVAGGKGGIGKSVITTNLAIALAKMGYPTVVVDLDLGGSNLHTMLGYQNRYPSIGDFLMQKDRDLSDYLVDTRWPALQFIPGDGRTPFMANISSGHKAKLLRQLRQLPARFILLDLGAGTSYNTMDFFRVTPYGLVITTPERPAVMNMLTFLKNVLFRSIEQFLRKEGDVNQRLQQLFASPMGSERLTVGRLSDEIGRIDPQAVGIVDRVCREFQPRLVLNMAQQPADLEFLTTATTVMRQVLSIEATHFGLLFDDPAVRAAVRAGQPLLEFAPDSLAAQGINHLAVRMVRMWNTPIQNSEDGLRRYVAKFHQQVSTAKPSAELSAAG